MRQNIQRTEERGGRIDNLNTKTNDLRENANRFKRGSNRVRKQLHWKNVRMGFYIALGIIVIIIVIALSLSAPGCLILGSELMIFQLCILSRNEIVAMSRCRLLGSVMEDNGWEPLQYAFLSPMLYNGIRFITLC